jgi:hypothetical protein
MSDVVRSEDARARARAALASLPRIERFACGALVVRQISYPRVLLRIDQDGPEAAVKFCNAKRFRRTCCRSSLPCWSLPGSTMGAAQDLRFSGRSRSRLASSPR